MATLDTDLVDKELRAIIATSKVIGKMLKDCLEQMEEDPSVFEELKIIPPAVRELGNLVAIRKAELTHHRHNFRIVFAHWRFETGDEHCDLLLAFPRKKGYRIDWAWVDRTLRTRRK